MKSAIKVFILTEGGGKRGFGHLTRCISLYQAFEEEKIVPDLIVNGDKKVKECLKVGRYQIFNWLKQKSRLFNLVANADVLIIDSYLANRSYYEELSDLVKLPVYIDDNKRLDYPSGLVLNGSIFAERIKYQKYKKLGHLLGTKYMPLRRDFWRSVKKPIKRDIESIMITFGGSDPINLTPKILRFLINEYPDFEMNAVIGMGFNGTENIKNEFGSKVNLICQPKAPEMKKIMLNSDIAISSGGQTLYELAAVGLPAIVIAAARNQLSNINGWQRVGFIKYIGWFYDKRIFDKLRLNLNLLKNITVRKKMIKSGRNFIDGKGARRAVNYMIQTLARKA